MYICNLKFIKKKEMANTEKLGAKQELEAQESEKKLVVFFQKNQKIIYGVLIAILIIIILIVAVYKFYLTPRNEKASEAMLFPIEQYAIGVGSNDSLILATALDGNEENDGFLTIIDNYGSTKAGNTAKCYAALCYIQQKKYDEALELLLQYKKKDDQVWYYAQMLIGDLYDETQDVDNAKKYYKKAIKGGTTLVAPAALFKLGKIFEREENWEEAFHAYQEIEDNYYERFNEMGVAKYLEQAKIKANK